MAVPRLSKPNLLPLKPKLRKISFEEHFLVPEGLEKDEEGKICQATIDRHTIANGLSPDWCRQVYDRLMDFDETRIQSMNESGIDYAILGFMSPGIGAIADAERARDTARAVNDALAEKINRHPDRFGGFASLALHDMSAAVRELERCIKTLGFKGVMINGFNEIGGDGDLLYLDDERCLPLWEALSDLDVPLYLHPRTPYQQVVYESHRELINANWGFACETGTHAVRILVGGVFDRFPAAKLILGHSGETIPFAAWRLQHWMEFNPGYDKPKKRIEDYLAENVYTTISGNWSVPALLCTMQVMGSDRILFSVDYPFENMDEGAEFLENAPISENDRAKIAYGNAKKLFKL